MLIGPYEGNPSEWDCLVNSDPAGTVFHRYGWRNVMETELGHSCSYLAARDRSGNLVGLLPLVFVGSHLFGRFLMSMPFLNYGGPLGCEEVVSGLGMAAREEGKRRKAQLVELRSVQPLSLDWPVSHRKITVVLDLPEDPDSLFDSFKSKLRSQIRRPTKGGVVVRIGPDHLDDFYAVFAHHMRDLGTPVQSRGFFRGIIREFPESVRVAVAYLGKTPVAGGVGFIWKEEMELTWASSLREYNRAAANMAVYWELIRRSIHEGVKRFNFGRCTPGSGSHRFKTQWGGRDTPLFWYQTTWGSAKHTPSPDQPAYSWATRAWRRLPLWLANRLGPHIVRLIP